MGISAEFQTFIYSLSYFNIFWCCFYAFVTRQGVDALLQ